MPASVAASFQRKIEILEGYVEYGIPAGAFVPRTVEELARWGDEALGITSWTSQKVVSPGYKYKDMRVRFDRVLPKLLAASPMAAPVDAGLLKRENIAMAEQAVLLRLMFNRQQRIAERYRQRTQQEVEKNEKLTRDLANLAGFPKTTR